MFYVRADNIDEDDDEEDAKIEINSRTINKNVFTSIRILMYLRK